MAQQHHTLLTVGALGGAGFLAYEYLYKPWKAQQDAAAAASSLLAPTATSPASAGGGGSFVDTGLDNPPAPYITAPTSPIGIQPSNLDPGATVGGAVGTAMTRKNWTQQQATDRINALTTTYNAAVSNLNALLSGQTASQIQAAIASETSALNAAAAPYNAALARGDAATANQWKIAIDGHNQDIAELNARLQAIQSNITAYQQAIAGYQTDYYNLTGLTLG